jgi:SAM-dependent methyltransferase
MKNFVLSLLGIFWYAWLVARYRNTYFASNELYKAMQGDSGLRGRSTRAIAEGALGRVIRDYAFLRENVNRAELTSRVVAEYSDDSLAGYGDESFTKGGSSLAEQQRGTILPLLERALQKHTAAGALKTIVEIGTGNGDVIAYLAERYPFHRYIGVDFSVRTAQKKYEYLANAKFMNGYALQMLRAGSLTGDIVFASSTFCVFAPKELQAYVENLAAAGFSEVVLSEPTWAGYRQANTDEVVSRHLENSVWFHNYAGYLRAAQFEILDFRFFHYRHPASLRPDIHLALVHGERMHSERQSE